MQMRRRDGRMWRRKLGRKACCVDALLSSPRHFWHHTALCCGIIQPCVDRTTDTNKIQDRKGWIGCVCSQGSINSRHSGSRRHVSSRQVDVVTATPVPRGTPAAARAVNAVCCFSSGGRTRCPRPAQRCWDQQRRACVRRPAAVEQCKPASCACVSIHQPSPPPAVAPSHRTSTWPGCLVPRSSSVYCSVLNTPATSPETASTCTQHGQSTCRAPVGQVYAPYTSFVPKLTSRKMIQKI